MSRTALAAIDDFDILAVDSFLFLGAGSSERASGRRDVDLEGDVRLEQTADKADGPAADGLATAADPTADLSGPETPPALGFQPGSPAVPNGAKSGAADITFLWPSFGGAAKGGTPGKPDGGGGGEGDGGGGGVLPEYFAGNHDGTAGYDIWIEFKGTWTADLQQAFILAADYFTGTATDAAVITDDIGGGGRYRGKTIDDLYVTAEVKAIDGEGGVLGQAGPEAIWTQTNLTAAGTMEFDVADADNYLGRGLWDDIVTHELMHVLGFGTLWEYGRDLVDDAGFYTGLAGNAAYDGPGPIPVEQDGGPGTAGKHWDEETLGHELMTGFINDDKDPGTNTDNYLSDFSVMSLADLGYAVDYRDYPYDDTLLV